jgi:hypothetical protein
MGVTKVWTEGTDGKTILSRRNYIFSFRADVLPAESGAIEVRGTRQVSPDIMKQIVSIRHGSGTETVWYVSAFTADALPITKHPITVGEWATGGSIGYHDTTLPLHSVDGMQ